MSDNYYLAGICLNGHTIDSYSKGDENFCTECGSKTVTECPDCKSSIRGRTVLKYLDCGIYLAPAYCYNCGKPYPWTQSKFKAIQELVNLDENLSSGEKDYINNNINSLTVDTPKTTVVATKFVKFLNKADSATNSTIKDILVDISSEAAKKIIFPQ